MIIMAFDRAERRHHAQRLKKKWEREFKATRPWLSDFPEGFKQAAGRALQCAGTCSCWVCGMDRRLVGPTIQERRLFQRENDE